MVAQRVGKGVRVSVLDSRFWRSRAARAIHIGQRAAKARPTRGIKVT
jgi:hypothetical protein